MDSLSNGTAGFARSPADTCLHLHQLSNGRWTEQLFPCDGVAFSSSPPPYEHTAEDDSRFVGNRECSDLVSARGDLSDGAATTGLASGNASQHGTPSTSRVRQECDVSVAGTNGTLKTGRSMAIESEELVCATSQLRMHVELEPALDSAIDSKVGDYDYAATQAAKAFVSSGYDNRGVVKHATEEASLAAEDWLEVAHAMLDCTGPDPDFRCY